MIEQSQPSQDFQEIRARGREQDFKYLLTDIGLKLANSRNRDVYNDFEALNTYESLIRHLHLTMAGYHDEQYWIELREIEAEIPAIIAALPFDQRRFAKVDVFDEKYAAIMRLQKRKVFTPSDDVMSNSFIIVESLSGMVRAEMDAMVAVTGLRGSGKSTLAIKLAEEVSEELGHKFSVKRDLFFSSNALREYIYATRPKPGRVFVYDEAGADRRMGRRRATTREAIEFNEVLQVIRELGLVIFYTAPEQSDLIEKNVNMFGARIETIKIIKSENLNLVKFKIKRKTDTKVLWEYPRAPSGERITTITIKKPLGEITKSYKAMKREFMYGKVKVDKREKVVEEIFQPNEFARTIIEEGVDKFKGPRGAFDIDRIRSRFKKLGIGRNKANEIKFEIERLMQYGPDTDGKQEAQQGA